MLPPLISPTAVRDDAWIASMIFNAAFTSLDAQEVAAVMEPMAAMLSTLYADEAVTVTLFRAGNGITKTLCVYGQCPRIASKRLLRYC